MKKLFTLALILFAGLSLVKAQSLTFDHDTVNYVGTTASSNENDLIGNCTNTTNATMTVNWSVIESTGPAGWDYPGFCDKNLCYVLNIGAVHGFTLNAGESGIMKLEIIGHCTPGSGHATLRLWNAADSANSVLTIPYVARLNQSVTCPTGITAVEAGKIEFYPNPVRDMAHLAIPGTLDNGQIDIYNLLGSRVYSGTVRGDKDIDLSSLDAGLYIARISDGGKVIATRKFTKAE
ncbi:MAG: T9SS type A sorting domain-containing protein [Bacteroidetes bacterium]|nr:T9SS type A sorting domain-containing protein [Bacteroidota bacterium]